MHGAAAAARYALEVDVTAVAERTGELASRLRQALTPLPGVRITDHGARLGAIVTCRITDQDPHRLLAELRRESVHGAVGWEAYALYDLARKAAPWVLRLSPHYYNTTEEISEATKKIFKIICC